MKSSELDSLLRLLRKHKVAAYENGPIKLAFHPMALVDELPAPSRKKRDRDTGPSEEESVLLPGDDPDLLYGTEN